MEQYVELEQDEEVSIEFSQCPLCQSYRVAEERRVYNCERCGTTWKPVRKYQE